jgi:hypothetical protein
MPTPWEKEEFRIAQEWEKKSRNSLLTPIPCISTWMDICGFGQCLEKALWSLEKLQKIGTVNVLSEVYQRVGHPLWIGVDPEPYENVLIINDGIARTVDLPAQCYASATQALFYVRDLVLGHLSLLRLTSHHDLGVRTVLAGGERIQYSPPTFTGNSVLYHGDNPSEYGKKLLEKNFLYNPAEFQMNTAFSKAYSIDSMGSKKGFKVNGFFIEQIFFKQFTVIKDIDIEINNSSVLFTHKGRPALELNIKTLIPFSFKGLATIVYHISSVRVDESFEGEETLIDLVNFKL